MTHDWSQTVRGILRSNLRPGSSEASREKRSLLQTAIENGTPGSLQAFIEIHEALAELAGKDHCRTRHTLRTSTGGIGIQYFTHPFGNRQRGRGDIQSVLLPTVPRYKGFIESYFIGHDEPPVTGATVITTRVGQHVIKFGHPTFQVIRRPSSCLASELVAAFRRSSQFSKMTES